MIPVTKREASIISEIDSRIFFSHPTKNGKVYMTETPRTLKILEKIRNGDIESIG